MRVMAAMVMCAVSWTPAQAFDTGPLNTAQQQCYGNAMVGYDSVINSRLGVPPEHALDLARIRNIQAGAEARYEIDVLRTILGAYIWQESPHTYAIKVFYECATRDKSLQSASNTLAH